jgi:hypothetical protein
VRSARRSRLALVLVTIGWLLAMGPATVLHAQTATPTATASPPGAIETGDPRSDGQGPGLVGEPLLVLVGIVVIGVATVVVTIVIARATGRA